MKGLDRCLLRFRRFTSLTYQINKPFKLISISIVDNLKEESPLFNLPFKIRKKLFDWHTKNFSKFVNGLHRRHVLTSLEATDRFWVETRPIG